MPRQKQRYTAGGGLNNNLLGSDQQGINALVLKNAYRKQAGGYHHRGGSITETITTGLDLPLGGGEHIGGASGSLIPVTRKLLINFGGTAFYSLGGGTWSSETVDTNLTLSATKQTDFAQVGGNLCVCGGTPAKWDGSGDVDRLGIPAPAGTITTATSGTGITAVTGYKYFFTYYNSSNGLESDWSPLSTDTGAFTNKQVDLTIPTTAASAPDVDQVRVYRNLDGGSEYYLLVTQAIGTGTYADTTDDVTLQGNTSAAVIGDRDICPTTSYIVEAFRARYWMVDADDPRTLRYSKPFIGNDNDLEYYPTEQAVYFNEPITGLQATPQQLLVFHPRSISQITGFSKLDFRASPLMTGVGTMFNHSICTNGQSIVFLAEEGFVDIGQGGKIHISQSIDEDLQPLINQLYNDNLYVTTTWNPSLRQFQFVVTALSNAAGWQTVTGEIPHTWSDTSSGAIVDWDDTVTPGNQAVTRVKCWGWAPDDVGQGSSGWSEYEFTQFTDLNSSGAYPTFVFHPLPSSDEIEIQQDETYFLYYDGTDGHVLSAHRRDVIQDDGTDFNYTIVTERIEPGQKGNIKRFNHVQFNDSYSDPSSQGATISYLRNFSDPHKRDYTSNLEGFSDQGDVKRFLQGTARYVNLVVTGSASDASRPLLDDFVVHFKDRKQREAR